MSPKVRRRRRLIAAAAAILALAVVACAAVWAAPGDSFELGGARVEILGPRAEYEYPNDTSIVCRVTYGETSFLFGGDAEWRAEKDLADSGADLSAGVLHVNHHGSGWSSNREFLQKVRPRWAVISVGENDFNLPSERVLARLRDIGATVLRTGECGTIRCASDRKTIHFSTLRDEVQTD